MSETVYKRTLSGSIGSGMKSVMGGGRRYYVLEHKVSSQYHKAGESQKIIVDQIEIGRDAKCQVRFDESFATVSRRHAAIVKDGDSWKLIQLSKTNSTYLNGHKVEKEWYLQSGDEIQISTNGPKLGFIVPQGDKSLVRSIGLTARLSLFRQQALKPYKAAIAILSVALFLSIAVFSYLDYERNKQMEIDRKYACEKIDSLECEKARQQEQIEILTEELLASKAEIVATRNEVKVTKKRLEQLINPKFEECYPDVFFIRCYKITVEGKTVAECNPEKDFLMCGTGFILDDGKFVTAKHVIDPLGYSNYYSYSVDSGWHFGLTKEQIPLVQFYMQLNALESMGGEVVFHFKASSNKYTISFTNKEFTMDYSKDYRIRVDEDIVIGGEPMVEAGSIIRFGSSGEMDWAFASVKQPGQLTADYQLSLSIPQGTQLFSLGYPLGRGEDHPVLAQSICSQNTLDVDGTIMASNSNDEGGNSGGPVLMYDAAGKVKVVGIVSGSTFKKARYVPIACINK